MKTLLTFLCCIVVLTDISAQNDPVTDTICGHAISDPYRWMEDIHSERSQKWLDAQKEMIRTYDRNIAPWYHPDVTQRSRYRGMPERSSGFFIECSPYYFLQGQYVYKCRDLHDQGDFITRSSYISDGREINIQKVAVSRDRSMVAINFMPDDSIYSEIRVTGIEGKVYPDHIKNVWGSNVVWYQNGFFYVRARSLQPQGQYSYDADQQQQLCYHRIGEPASSDSVVFYRKSRPEDALSAMVSYDEKYLSILAINKERETYSVFCRPLTGGGGMIACASGVQDRYYPQEVCDGRLYALRYSASQPNGRLEYIELAAPDSGWQVLIPQLSDSYIMSADFLRDKIVLNYKLDQHHDVAVYDYRGKMQHLFEMPPGLDMFSVGTQHFDTAVCFYEMSLTQAPSVDAFDMVSYKFKNIYTTESSYHSSRFRTEYRTYKSADGTEIPMKLLYSENAKLTGHNPTIMDVGEGYDAPAYNRYNENILAWLDMGGVYAICNIRGGLKPGADWERAGRKEGMERAIEDIEAGVAVLTGEYTDPAHLAVIAIRSAALQVATVVMRHPAIVHACCLVEAPYDLLRSESLTHSAILLNEHGSMHNDADKDRMCRLSPYQAAITDAKYPALYIACHRNDIIPFAHSMKFAARMQLEPTTKNICLFNLSEPDDRAISAGWHTYERYNNIWRFLHSELNVRH